MKARTIRRVACPQALLALAVVLGCRTVHRSAEEARSSVMSADGTVAMERAVRMAESSVNHALGQMEVARLHQLRGDRAASAAAYGPELERLFADKKEGPFSKKGALGGQILAATVADDTAIPYELPPFEMIFALQYQALNRFAEGDFDDAGVYLRRATWVQEKLREQNAAADAKAAKEADKKHAAASKKAIGQIDAQLAPIASTVRASYENALVWYLQAMWLDCDEQSSDAELAYREAVKIAPAAGAFPRGGADDILVVYEEGLVDLRYPIKIPLPIGGTVVSCDFPVYRGKPYRPRPLVASFGSQTTNLVRIVDVQALGYRDLKDRIPGMVTRNITRTATKIAAQQAANHINTGNTYANLALSLGVLAYNLCSTIVVEADTRCWTTLPECVSIARFRRQPGVGTLRLASQAGGSALDIAIPKDVRGPLLVWVSDVGASACVTVAPFKGGSAAASVKMPSLVGVGDGRFR